MNYWDRGKMGKSFFWISLAPLLLINFFSCRAPYPLARNGAEKRNVALSRMKCIVVLPFYNLSERVDAEVLTTNIFIGEITNDKHFSTVKYGDIRSFLLEQKIRSTDTIDRETLQLIANEFKADGIMLGTINTYTEWNPDKEKEPAVVDISVRIVDCRNGRILWFDRKRRTSWDEQLFFDFGERVFCSQLVQLTARELVGQLQD